MHLTEKRDGSVRHKTSPSCRDCPRQVVIPSYVKIRSATPETQFVQSLRPSAPPAHSNPLTCLAFGAVGWLVRISLVRNQRDASASPEKFRHRPTILILL